MMKAIASMIAMFSFATTAISASAPAAAQPPAVKWVEGRNYYLIVPARPSALPPGKVEVTEVFSYACPACNQFQSYMHKLKQSIAANAVLDYVPASFQSAEDWPMFQLAFVTAQSLGIADQTHDAMFDAVWTTGELSINDPASGTLKSRMPTIEDAARFYEKHAGVPAAKFLSAAKSFPIDTQIRKDEDLIKAYGVDRTPTLIVNGKYRVVAQSAGGPDQVVELINWLVAKESK
jgi:protein dithiol oxidoreductase (disulfide-forming)